MTSLVPSHQSVKVSAHARLHMGFLDLCGDLGRQFGSLGVSLEGILTDITISDKGASQGSAVVEARGNDAERAKRYAETLCAEYSVKRELSVDVTTAIRPHAGLGSGTQMALAIGHGLSRQFELGLTSRNIARVLNRGQRSSIGINTFEQGGFHIDCGNSNTATPALPQVLFSTPYPDEWRFILLFDHRNTGLHGSAERQAFTVLEPMPAATADHLCRLAIMQVVPGLLDQNFAAFAAAITEIQAQVGDHFAPVQGGRFVSAAVREQLDWYAGREQSVGYGQSSWGPTGFVLCENSDIAAALVEAAADAMPDNECEVVVTGASNEGASIFTSGDSG